MNYVTPSGSYYEGNRADLKDQECSKKPSNNHEWNGNSWVLNLDKYKIEAVIRIKTSGLSSINSMYPLATGTQTNMLKRQAQILHKRIMSQVLTSSEIEEENILINAGIWIDNINESIDSAVYTIMTATSKEQIDAVTLTLPAIPAPTWAK